MGFPTSINVTQAPGVEGDFASANPRHSALAPTGDGTLSGFIAGAAGLTIGRFCWAGSGGVTVSNSGQGVPLGFVHRDMQALITAFLAENSLVIPQGLQVGNIFDAGDFWVRNAGTGAITRGLKVFASFIDGSARFAAAGSTIQDSSFTGAISGTTLTVSAGSGLVVGQLIAGAGVTARTYITALGTGNGGAGTYTVSVSQTVASEAMTGTNSVETAFYAATPANAGELVKMTNIVQA